MVQYHHTINDLWEIW